MKTITAASLVAAACTVAIVSGCSSGSDAPTNTPPPTSTPPTAAPPTPSGSLADVTRDETQLSNPITLVVGQRAVITLASNQTTGYAWGLAQPLDERIIKLAGSEYIAPSTPIPGRGGSEQWTFVATGAGQTTVSMKYFRSFEPAAAPANQASFITVVKQH